MEEEQVVIREKRRMEYQLQAGHVARWHTCPIIGGQSVGEHTYGICQIIRRLTEDHPSRELMLAALDHDVPETETGDVPFKVKRRNPGIKAAMDATETAIANEYGLQDMAELSDYDKLTLKFADLAEMGHFALRQFNMGNRYMAEVLFNVCKALRDLGEGKELPQVFEDVYNELCNALHRINDMNRGVK